MLSYGGLFVKFAEEMLSEICLLNDRLLVNSVPFFLKFFHFLRQIRSGSTKFETVFHFSVSWFVFTSPHQRVPTRIILNVSSFHGVVSSRST